MQNINQEEKTKIMICAADLGEYDVENSLDELTELVNTAGGEVVMRITQKRPSFEKATCIGSGRLEEMAQICRDMQIDQIIFDHELTATQIRNIEDACGVHTIDRTMLILDIFAQRATTKEGKLQVSLAQYKYRLPRLAGMGINLSRQGGGIGTRGPGETKLETDKRHIRTRIAALTEELKEIEKRREFHRSRRKKDGVLVCAITGYTNAGKSTLMNTLTDAGVLEENKLFATLETTSRSIELEDGRTVMLVDTVGFIRRLPHHLVEAFKSTLEEAANADIILNVCDAGDPDVCEKAKVTTDLLHELGCDGIEIINVFNKCDTLENPEDIHMDENSVLISAKQNIGLDRLLKMIQDKLSSDFVRTEILLPFSEAGLLNKIRIDGKVFSEEYKAEGILADALIDNKIFYLYKNYVCE